MNLIIIGRYDNENSSGYHNHHRYNNYNDLLFVRFLKDTSLLEHYHQWGGGGGFYHIKNYFTNCHGCWSVSDPRRLQWPSTVRSVRSRGTQWGYVRGTLHRLREGEDQTR